MQATAFLEEKFKTAEKFLETIRVTNQRWNSKKDSWETSWIFRGQPNSNWSLVPSAWRNDNLKRFKQKYRAKYEHIFLEPLQRELEEIARLTKKGEFTATEGEERVNTRSIQTNRELALALQYFAEMQAVKEFTDFANRLGHPVPGASEFIVTHQSNFKNLSEEDYLISQFARWTPHSDPFNVNCSAVALAQHHGVPTRLLDWTENPFIAAFFAAEELTSAKDANRDFDLHEGRIAVWAISKEIFSGNDNAKEIPSPLQLIERPRHEIGYLLAQKAVFTRDKGANGYFLQTGRWRSVEDAIDNSPDCLKKLTLPVREVGELLRLLWLEGISRAHLMPTYDNVTRALQTKAWWENSHE